MKTKTLATIFQVFFWLMIMVPQVAVTSDFLDFKAALLFSAMNTLMAMAVFYLNTHWIFPSFFEKRRFLLYILVNILLIGLLSHIFFKIDASIIRNFITVPIPDNLPHFAPYARISSIMLFVLIVSLIYSLIRKVQSQEMAQEQLHKEKSDTEIRLLKAQINPHFIFNSLNNIYSLSYSKSDDAPEAVLKLSEMLRYVYYDCNRDEVTLGAEIEYIRNYMSFQQMKSPQEQDIELLTEGIDESYRIAPMLFIPFVENAFKYSKIEDQKDAWVKMKMSTEKGKLCFHIRNTHPENGNTPGSGMGMENVRNRLGITYPGKHSLDINDKDGVFEVHMKISQS